MINRPTIETLLSDPNATITEFPIAYAGLEETGINDQTESRSLPYTYTPQPDINGVISVSYSNRLVKLGQYIEVTLQKLENSQATCDLKFYERTLRGMQKYDVAPVTDAQAAVTAFMPIFKCFKMDTSVTLALDSWISMGELIKEQSISSGEVVKTRMSTWIRILSPQE